jgi:ferrous iron transport protein B
VTIALIGNPNSGKTTLFNELTGANQHVGNWPGVTVEQKSGHIRPRYGEGEIIDLPGIYSLSPFSLEEVVSRDYLIKEKPDVVINIVDATNLERNLYLTIQLIELNAPIVVALNMMDEVTKTGYRINVESLSRDLGVPVVPISAAKVQGIKELVAALPEAHISIRHMLPNSHLEHLIALVEVLLRNHLEQKIKISDYEVSRYPLHWTAIKVLENDELVLHDLNLDDITKQAIEALMADFEAKHGLICSAFANARYELIHQMIYKRLTRWSEDGSHYHYVKHAPEGYHLHTECEESELLSPPYPAERMSGSGDDDDVGIDWHGSKGTLHNDWPPESLFIAKDQDSCGCPQQDPCDLVGLEDSSLQKRRNSRQCRAGKEPSSSRGFSQLDKSDRLDKIFTHRIWAIPIFLLMIFAIFHITFSSSFLGIPGVPSPGVWLQKLVSSGIDGLSGLLASLFSEGSWAKSLVIDGVIGGIGAVLSFVPQIMLLFLFLTLLEDCGYMSRAAFIMDRFLRRFGLSGKSFLPMLMGFGCTVPAVMATRTMENENERRLTLMLVPFMACGARTPIFLVLAGAFFPAYADILVFALYLLGILVAILSGILLRKLIFKGASLPFMIELPRYRLPRLRSVLMSLWDKLKGFLVRAGTIIFVMCVVIWVLSSFGIADGRFQMVDIDQSLLAALGNLIAPLFTPLGFGTWFAAVALLTGFVTKESVVSTLGTLSGIGVGDSGAVGGAGGTGGLTASALQGLGFVSPVAALSFMVFCLLYVPCVATVATLKKEFGSWKWTLAQVGYSVSVAYVLGLLVYQIGSLFVA